MPQVRYSRHRSGRACQAGTSIAETLIAIVMVVMVGLGAAQWALIYHAKVLLDYAALQGARAGAVRNASANAITAGVARALLPLYMPGATIEDADDALHGSVVPDLQQYGDLRILNPTQEAFEDFGMIDLNGDEFIPNDSLTSRDSSEGAQSGLSIQDANLLKVEITYGYQLNVPVIGHMMTGLMRLPFIGNVMEPGDGYEYWEVEWLRDRRLPIRASATVRMHSSAYRNAHMVDRASLVQP